MDRQVEKETRSVDLSIMYICHEYFFILFPGWGGALPIMDYTGRLRPKAVLFSAVEVYKRVGISRVEV